ncbi:hypothetical protein HLH34_07760 [Gluconacetobacter azotocaptans]|uniref:Uncharacterized protein n=1 Tax=Gluconacetobacter azotocaptans TaxID=142834 RepID=A0A7W4JS64_9PROT|nr:hypothetical protein [Gluconacetobacter azotocaptans]MBB2189862.1 hypothetical protein [Gluconacetobacter azotocaptans]MBM9402677.1 hypothetical protein [Gluconacetobacter azotocaptans]GBQ29502.1 hypothetical protein AA13594_1376 [Gluconacetobacter azotocaptans DSM 13594]
MSTSPDTPPASKIVWIVMTVVLTIGIGIYAIKTEFDSLRAIGNAPAGAPATEPPTR